MRAMILAAGLGTRMRPLSDFVAKPALPVLGRPVIGYLLELLAAAGIREVLVNLHHLAETIEDAVERSCPAGIQVRYQRESVPLGTGGGIARARDFLEADDPTLVLAGDMLLDLDLRALTAHHESSGNVATLALLEDPRAEQFGTIGLDDAGHVRRIASRFDLGGETRRGVFVGVRVLSPGVFDLLPQNVTYDTPFEDLSDWLAPALAAGDERIGGCVVASDCVWQPVGTPEEYLQANLAPPSLRFLPPTKMLAPGTHREGRSADVIVGPGARIGAGAELSRCVIWENEILPEGLHASGGVFARGNFYDCESDRGETSSITTGE